LRRKLAQVVFGSFMAIFAYCLLLMAAVREPADLNHPFVPSFSICFAIVLALVALGLLVVFIHRLALTIQVSTTMAALASSTAVAIDAVHPLPWGQPGHGEDGYVGLIDAEACARALTAASQTVEMLVRPGDFVTPRTPVIAFWPSDSTAQQLLRHVQVSPERDVDHDPEFGSRQLADITLRAISPGINDPTTAVTCIGYLKDVLEHLTERALPAHRTVGTTASLVVRGRSFEEYLEVLVQIGRYATTDATVVIALLNALQSISRTATGVGAVDRSLSACKVAAEIADQAFAASGTAQDRERVAHHLQQVGR
jgi:uncharacterized membrane protein